MDYPRDSVLNVVEEPSKHEHSDDFPYLEQLQYLKEISDQQRLLNRTESQVERCYDNFQECHALVERCTSELQKLREEKKLLMDRLAAIETDISKLSDVSKQLKQECGVQCASAPLQEYARQLDSVNILRQATQLPPLAECSTYQQLQQVCMSGNVEWKRKSHKPKVQRAALLSSSTSSFKAGPSYKLCPSCVQQVSRNAVSCPHCNAACSKSYKIIPT